MAKAYFLNAQSGEISIQLNAGPAHMLAALDDQSKNPYWPLDLAANKDKDILGTNADNSLVVITTGKKNAIDWRISMQGILPNEDIQFLVFDNQLLARQRDTVNGFDIRQDS